MTNFDLSPLYRSTVGFDHLFDMLDQASRVQPATWPPYNIERVGEDQYRIVMALAGFEPDEIELVQKENMLWWLARSIPTLRALRSSIAALRPVRSGRPSISPII